MDFESIKTTFAFTQGLTPNDRIGSKTLRTAADDAGAQEATCERFLMDGDRRTREF